MTSPESELNEVLEVWPVASRVLSRLESERQYEDAVRRLDALIDEVSYESDPLKESLIETLGTLVKDYEDRHVAESEGDPIGVLKYLMKEHGLKQRDLSELGSQGVVSEILGGKRKLNLRQVQALSKRFHVSPMVFFD